MPLTNKGEKIKRAMTNEYGAKKGEQVFYASKNKGKIKGVDEDPQNGLQNARPSAQEKFVNSSGAEGRKPAEDAEPQKSAIAHMQRTMNAEPVGKFKASKGPTPTQRRQQAFLAKRAKEQGRDDGVDPGSMPMASTDGKAALDCWSNLGKLKGWGGAKDANGYGSSAQESKNQSARLKKGNAERTQPKPVALTETGRNAMVKSFQKQAGSMMHNMSKSKFEAKDAGMSTVASAAPARASAAPRMAKTQGQDAFGPIKSVKRGDTTVSYHPPGTSGAAPAGGGNGFEGIPGMGGGKPQPHQKYQPTPADLAKRKANRVAIGKSLREHGYPKSGRDASLPQSAHSPVRKLQRAVKVPGRDVIAHSENNMHKAHNREAMRNKAQFTNYGHGISETGIASKTNKGTLQTEYHPTKGYIHSWPKTGGAPSMKR